MNGSRFALGVGGHQHLGSEETQHFVEEQFRAQLASSQQREPHLILYSALALGADQLFVQIALELGIQVEIVLPCAEYEALFSSEGQRATYQRLLHAAHAMHRLPIQQCSNEAFLAAEHWIIDRSDLAILAWNGLPPQGRSGTDDMASYARFVGCPFVHLDTRRHLVKTYGEVSSRKRMAQTISPKQAFAIAQQPVSQGTTLVVKQYRIQMPDGQEVIRDVVVRPDSLFILPVGQQNMVQLIEEYDFGAGTWQLTLPGGKVEGSSNETLLEQAQKELRQKIGYRAGRLEKLIDLYSHPGYISHRVPVFIAYDLEWDPLKPEMHEEIKVQTYPLEEALAATLVDHRCDPEAALALWLYAQKATS